MTQTQPLYRTAVMLGQIRHLTAPEQVEVLHGLLAQPELAQAAREFLTAAAAAGVLPASVGTPPSGEDIW